MDFIIIKNADLKRRLLVRKGEVFWKRKKFRFRFRFKLYYLLKVEEEIFENFEIVSP